MALHLGNLYSLVKEKCNNEIDLIAGDSGLDNVVRWMYVVEGVEISHFLEGNELVFTTGIALKGEGELPDLVKESYNRGASGIVINVGPYIKEIPQEIIEFCNEKSFPLFRIPWQAGMVHIMRIFTEEITLFDKRNMELISAVKNAIYFQNNYDLYVPALERYGYHMEWSYCIAVCECTDKSGENIENNVLESIKKFIENSMSMLIQSAVVFCMENQIVMFFGNIDEDVIEDSVNSVIKSLPDNIREKANIYIGVGRNAKSMRCINETFNIASKVAKLQKKRMVEGETVSYHALGISSLLLAMDDVEAMREFYGEVLEKLVKYDELNHTNFVGFLKAYFTYGGHVREAAEGMYMHRNSINYKLRKIEEILGCDFSDVNTKAQILIALKLMELL